MPSLKSTVYTPLQKCTPISTAWWRKVSIAQQARFLGCIA